ncbi:MAG TPA: carboxymuconolactone decarboxylase family protein [Miltoncostaeaceae bacterium]|nr:carboxymuconolactone decarboxylase family protein [Miltoncostaeaceae bacterium]
MSRIHLQRNAPDARRALAALSRSADLEHRLAELVKVRVSQMNGCAYCVDLHARLAREAGEDERRLHVLALWREAPFFDDRERAALALAEALTDLGRGPLPEQVWEDAARSLTDHDLTALVVTVTSINAWNRVMIATGAQPPPLDDGDAGAP